MPGLKGKRKAVLIVKRESKPSSLRGANSRSLLNPKMHLLAPEGGT